MVSIKKNREDRQRKCNKCGFFRSKHRSIRLLTFIRNWKSIGPSVYGINRSFECLLASLKRFNTKVWIFYHRQHKVPDIKTCLLNETIFGWRLEAVIIESALWSRLNLFEYSVIYKVVRHDGMFLFYVSFIEKQTSRYF